jgi:hypothetical protein
MHGLECPASNSGSGCSATASSRIEPSTPMRLQNHHACHAVHREMRPAPGYRGHTSVSFQGGLTPACALCCARCAFARRAHRSGSRLGHERRLRGRDEESLSATCPSLRRMLVFEPVAELFPPALRYAEPQRAAS